MTAPEQPGSAAVALMANCPLCWALPGFPCDPRGQHLARYQRAYRRGLLTRDELAAVVGGLTAIAGRVIVAAATARRAA